MNKNKDIKAGFYIHSTYDVVEAGKEFFFKENSEIVLEGIENKKAKNNFLKNVSFALSTDIAGNKKFIGALEKIVDLSFRNDHKGDVLLSDVKKVFIDLIESIDKKVKDKTSLSLVINSILICSGLDNCIKFIPEDVFEGRMFENTRKRLEKGIESNYRLKSKNQTKNVFGDLNSKKRSREDDYENYSKIVDEKIIDSFDFFDEEVLRRVESLRDDAFNGGEEIDGLRNKFRKK